MAKQPITQPDHVPTRKVGIGQAAASLVTIAAYYIEEHTELTVPLFVGTAFLQVLMFAIQYFTRDRRKVSQ